MTDNLEHEAIIDEAVHGRLLRDIAGARGMTVPQIRKIIDKGAAEAFSGEQLRRELFLEAKRLRKLGQRYFDRAMTGDSSRLGSGRTGDCRQCVAARKPLEVAAWTANGCQRDPAWRQKPAKTRG